MKNIKFRIHAFILTMLLCFGCSDFLDINDDPNNPLDAPVNQMLPATQFAMGYNLGTVTGGLSNAASAFMHQITSFRVDQYNITGGYVSNTWNGVFTGALNNYNIIIQKAQAKGDYRYAGIAKICKAYTYSVLVDLFGDLPFDEALLGGGNSAPHYQSGADIYQKCIQLLEDGKQDLVRPGGLLPGADDVIYGGNIVKWRRLANTIKLKMYNQIRKVDNVEDEINALLAEDDMITIADDFQLPFGTATQPPNRNPAYLAEYAGSGRESFVSHWFYLILNGANPDILTGVVDPRMPYYFYNQKANANVEANANFQDGRFITRVFGTTLANANVTNIQTLHGLYPIGGRYDDGAGGVGVSASGPGNGAQRLLTFFARKFIEAELQLEVLGNEAAARTAFEAGVRAAFTKVNAVAAAVPASVQAVPLISAANIDAYVLAALNEFDSGDADRKLEVIMTQKWIASYGYGIDSYTDYRRTGYPIIFDPVTDGDPTTISANPFPLRFPYRDQDLTSNPNAPEQPNIYSTKVFWQGF